MATKTLKCFQTKRLDNTFGYDSSYSSVMNELHDLTNKKGWKITHHCVAATEGNGHWNPTFCYSYVLEKDDNIILEEQKQIHYKLIDAWHKANERIRSNDKSWLLRESFPEVFKEFSTIPKEITPQADQALRYISEWYNKNVSETYKTRELRFSQEQMIILVNNLIEIVEEDNNESV